MTYKFLLSKHIFRDLKNKELGCYAQIEVETPFVPFVGLKLRIVGTDTATEEIIEAI